jgi:UDPglucose 6-dehydrogenase
MRFTNDPRALKTCGLIVCSSDVPTTSENQSELTVIHQLMGTVTTHAEPGTILIVLSQVPPGFTRALDDTLKQDRPNVHFPLFYQVETLAFGCAVERALQPERLMVGCRDPRVALPARYAELLNRFGCPVLQMRYESAELAKIAINMFLASSVCTSNTLAELSEAVGAEWSDIMPALRLDQRIGPQAYLKPGLGLAGGNLERDLATVSGLAGLYGTEAGLVDAWLANSRHRRDWVLKVLHDEEVLAQSSDPLIAVWGLAYKENTQSTKNSPALALLDAMPHVTTQVYDPHVILERRRFPQALQVPTALEACRGADVLAVMTPWDEFSSLSAASVREVMRGRLIVDPFGVMDHRQCASVGLHHTRLGSPTRIAERMPC